MPTTRSPLRYPGGKSALIDFIAELLCHNGLKDTEYVEPFAGGSGVAIELLLTDKVKRAILNDYDRSVWAFWKCVLEHTEELCGRIETARFSMKEWGKQRYIQSLKTPSLLDLGFSTLYMNRTNYSGIIRGGVIGGKRQTGSCKMDCRFNKDSLINKIKRIAERKSEIEIHRQDCLDFLGQSKHVPRDAFVYMDPPYYDKGGQLYLSDFDDDKHKHLAKLVSCLRQPWIMTYDCGFEINRIYASRERMPFCLNYSANIKSRGVEILMWHTKLKLPYKLAC